MISVIPSKHKLKEWNHTGLFYCVLCNKTEVELSESCEPKKIISWSCDLGEHSNCNSECNCNCHTTSLTDGEGKNA